MNKSDIRHIKPGDEILWYDPALPEFASRHIVRWILYVEKTKEVHCETVEGLLIKSSPRHLRFAGEIIPNRFQKLAMAPALERIIMQATEGGASASETRRVVLEIYENRVTTLREQVRAHRVVESIFVRNERMRRAQEREAARVTALVSNAERESRYAEEDESRREKKLAEAKERLLRREQRRLERELAWANARKLKLLRKEEALKQRLRNEMQLAAKRRKQEKLAETTEEKIKQKCKTLGEDMDCPVNRMSLYLYVDGVCSECGAEGYLLPFKGQTLCRECLCADHPDAEKKQFISSNFSQSVTISGAGTGGGRFHGVNATWIHDRYEWADNVIKSLPYKFSGKQFRELRNELVEWSNLHPRLEWRNARSMLLTRFAGDLDMYDMVPNNRGRRPGYRLENPTDIGDMT